MILYKFADFIGADCISEVFDAVEILNEPELREKVREYKPRLPKQLVEKYKLDWLLSPTEDIIDAFNDACDYDAEWYFIVEKINVRS